MKNQLVNALIFSSVLLMGCDPEVNPQEQVGKYSNGVLIINEGNFGSSDGEISFYKPSVDSIFHNVFNAENNIPFAGILQSIYTWEDFSYLVDNTGSVRKVEAKTFKLITEADGFTNPRDFVVADGKGFVADWGAYDDDWTLPASYVYIIDLQSLEKLDSIAVASAPEYLVAVNDKVFVSSIYADEITVINTQDFSKSTIEVPYGPAEMVMDKNDKLWVVCNNNLVQIDPATSNIETEIPLTMTANGGSASKLEINSAGDQLYFFVSSYNEDWTTSNRIYQHAITANSVAITPIVTGTNLYGMGVDAQGQIYIADHKNYAGNGEVRIYNAEGQLQKTFQAGRIPSDFIFLP